MSVLEAPLEAPLGGDGSITSAYRRMLMSLLPPGRVWRLFAGSYLSKLLDACANEIARVDVRARDLLNESNPSTTVELLPEHESELDLDPDGSTEERQARVLARRVARQRYRPADFQTALAPLLGLDAEDVVVIERSPAEAAAMGDVREIFRFFVYRDPTLPGTYYLDSAQELIGTTLTRGIKPSHTAGQVIQSIGPLYDDPYSLYDRDIYGVSALYDDPYTLYDRDIYGG